MRQVLIFGLIILTVGSCEDPIGEVFFESESSFIRGKAFYLEVSSGDTVRNSSDIVTRIFYQDGREITADIETSIKGASFQFGPLSTAQSFTVTSSYYDSVKKIDYIGTALLDSLQDGINEAEVLLLPRTSSASIKSSIQYIDLLTEEDVLQHNGIVTTLKSVGVDSEPRIITGSNFHFDDLTTGVAYEISSVLEDTLQDIIYTFDTVIVTNNENIFTEYATILIGNNGLSTIKGNVQFTDPATGVTQAATTAVGNLRFLDPLKAFPNNVSHQSSGSTYSFGPLVAGMYIREFTFQNESNSYFYSDTLEVIGTERIVFEEILLVRERQTVSKGTLHYIDPITGIEHLATEATGEIIFEDQTKFINEIVSTESVGENFSFGPLEPESYIRSFQFEDGIFEYIYTDTISIDGVAPAINEDIYLEPQGRTIFKGSLHFTNPISNVRQPANNGISQIRFLDPLRDFSAEVNIESNGSEFSFGPLIPGSYIINFQHEGDIFNYEYTDTVNLDGTSPIIFNNIELQPTAQTLMTGTILFNDPISGEEKIANNAEMEISFLDPLKSFDDGDFLTSFGKDFSLGPLSPDTYIRKVTHNDGVFDYHYCDTITTTDSPIVTYEEVYLVWKRSTGLLVRVTDDQGNLLSGANVYLYRNYNFLLTYLDDPSVATAYGVTGPDGSVVFSGLETGNMFVYATKVISNDTLTNAASNSTPKSMVPNIVRTMNTVVE